MERFLTATMGGNSHHADKTEFSNRAILHGVGERDIARQFPEMVKATLQWRMKPVSWTVSLQESVGLLAIAELVEPEGRGREFETK
jgi:hypothetical protein